jgi:hypothetical protein
MSDVAVAAAVNMHAVNALQLPTRAVHSHNKSRQMHVGIGRMPASGGQTTQHCTDMRGRATDVYALCCVLLCECVKHSAPCTHCSVCARWRLAKQFTRHPNRIYSNPTTLARSGEQLPVKCSNYQREVSTVKTVQNTQNTCGSNPAAAPVLCR